MNTNQQGGQNNTRKILTREQASFVNFANNFGVEAAQDFYKYEDGQKYSLPQDAGIELGTVADLPTLDTSSDYYRDLPRVDNKAVVQVRKDNSGDIYAFRLEDGTILDYNEMMVKQRAGQTQGILIGRNRQNEPTIRSSADGKPANNLDNLPLF